LGCCAADDDEESVPNFHNYFNIR